MTYIRRKDGIYDETKVCLIADPIAGEIFVEEMIDSYTSHLEKVIAQADTIEELCDEFVIENDYCGQISQSRYFDFEVAKQNIDIASNDVIYGALRIAGKGLIYVAKMNENGVLELI